MEVDLHHVMESIEFQMSLLLFAALAGYQLASLVKLPSVVGAVVAGLIVGPSLLNVISYGDFVATIAHLGAVVLLFIVGLEVNLKSIAQMKYAVIALFGVVVPWAGGFALAVVFGFDVAKALVLGVALTATSIALTAETFREAGVIKTPIAQAIIACAILDDVLALLAVGLLGSGGELNFDGSVIGVTLLKAITFLTAGIYVGRRWISVLLVTIDDSSYAERLPEISFVFAMMMAFAFSLLAEIAGLSAIVGAFIAGLSLEGVKLRKSHHVEEGADYLRAIFSAVFFVSLGVLADFSDLGLQDFGFAILLMIVAIATKVIGCGLPALFYRYSFRDALVIGLGMAPRGEVAMVVALLALTTGAIDQPAFLAIVVVAIGTSVIIPPVLRGLVKQS